MMLPLLFVGEGLPFLAEAKLLIAYGLIQQFHEPDEANRGEMAEKLGNSPSV
jgi:hypothetical protein